MALIIDASIAVKWYVTEEDSHIAVKLLDASKRLIAPELIFAEVGNVLWSSWRKHFIDAAHMDASLIALKSVIYKAYPIHNLASEALVLSRLLDHPIYDCIYLALAQKLESKIVTADDRFLKATKKVGLDAMLLSLVDATTGSP